MSAPPPPPSPPLPSDGVDSVYLTLTIVFGSGFGATLLILLAVCTCYVLQQRLKQRQSNFDVFLSYRVAADAALVNKLYALLIQRKANNKPLRVWLDKKNLPLGLRFEHSFVDGLRSSLVVVPVLSRQALLPFAELHEDSRCDNVLLEHTLALELKERSLVWAITPLLIGENTAYETRSRRGTDDHRTSVTDGRATRPTDCESHPPAPSPAVPVCTLPSRRNWPANLSSHGLSHPANLAAASMTSAGQPQRSAPNHSFGTWARKKSGGSKVVELVFGGDHGSWRSWSKGSHKRGSVLVPLVFDKDFFECGARPEFADDAEVREVWAKVEAHLSRIAQGFTPLSTERSVRATLGAVLEHQGVKLRGTTEELLAEAADAIVQAVEQAKDRPNSLLGLATPRSRLLSHAASSAWESIANARETFSLGASVGRSKKRSCDFGASDSPSTSTTTPPGSSVKRGACASDGSPGTTPLREREPQGLPRVRASGSSDQLASSQTSAPSPTRRDQESRGSRLVKSASTPLDSSERSKNTSQKESLRESRPSLMTDRI